MDFVQQIEINELKTRVEDLETILKRLLGVVEQQSGLIERLITITELERGV